MRLASSFRYVTQAQTDDEGRERACNLANVAAYGAYALASSALLAAATTDATAPQALGWLLLAGLVHLLVKWAVGPAVYLTLWLGHTPRTHAVLLAVGVPAGTVMALLAAATVLRTPPLGILALVLFALIVLLPQSFIAYAARTRPIARLSGTRRRVATRTR